MDPRMGQCSSRKCEQSIYMCVCLYIYRSVHIGVCLLCNSGSENGFNTGISLPSLVHWYYMGSASPSKRSKGEAVQKHQLCTAGVG